MTALIKEIWKPIPGYPRHEASNLGRIRSIPMISKRGHKLPSRVMKPSTAMCTVNPSYGYRCGPVRVGVLVLRAFKGIPAPGQMCRHLDDDPWHNLPPNLEWGTRKQNGEDASRNGRLNYEKTSEHKAKISHTLKGRKLPKKTRLRMSKGQKKRWARERQLCLS